MPCTEKDCCNYGKPRTWGCSCYDVKIVPADFKEQTGGACVAAIKETDDGLLEIQDMRDGTYSLIVHSRVGETDRFDDLSIRLDRKHFAMLGTIATR